MAKRFTKDGQKFYKVGDAMTIGAERYCCVTEEWLTEQGFCEYITKAEDGTDGIVDGKWIHYTGAPYVAPEPEPYVPTPEEQAAQAEAQRIAGINAEIESHKEAIAETDYIFTKCMEAQIVGADMPYDADYLEAIHLARQAHRDRINELEAELNPTEE